jgi:hypothetical protein
MITIVQNDMITKKKEKMFTVASETSESVIIKDAVSLLTDTMRCLVAATHNIFADILSVLRQMSNGTCSFV